MGGVSLFLKQFLVVLFLSLPDSECSGIKFDSLDLEGRQLYLMNDVGIFNKYEFGIIKAEEMCNRTEDCNNGGTCYNNVCLCLPGTSGPLCKTINSCNDLNCTKDKNAYCDFDQKNFKAYCKCPFGQEFDYDANICKDCLCDVCKKDTFCIRQLRCEFIRGEKTCTCSLDDFKYNPKKKVCEYCLCGEHSKSCEFDEDGNQKCKCEYSYAQRYLSCESCVCSNAYGCRFVNDEKVCTCYPDYVQKGDNCYKCTCGENGKCIWGKWLNNQEGCICDRGFVEVNGVCKRISDCYCGENSNCTIENNRKICSCPEGFTNISGLCVDINECDNPKACPENTKCLNLIGSYNCTCADGFQPSKDSEECEDINECQNSVSCADSNTDCINTVGSFSCVCKPGYATRDGISASPVCENKSSWKLGFGLLIGIFLALIIGLTIVIYKKSRN